MDTLDDLAARSAIAVRTQADSLAETESALADLKSGITVTTIAPLAERAPAQRWWFGVAAAAAVVGIVAVGVVVMTREDPDTVANEPLPPAVTTVAVTAVEPLDAGVSEPPTLTEADAQVLYETTVGYELGQLGVVDELRPLAPIVAPDGTLILGDPVNHRWILVREGETLEVEYDDNEFVWDAVLGVDGSLYSLVYNWSNKGLVNGRVQWQPTDFSGTGGYETNVGDCCRRLLYDGSFENGGEPQVMGDAVMVMDDAGAPMAVPSELNSLTAQYPDGTQRTWSIPSPAYYTQAELHALSTGELVVIQRLTSDSGTPTPVWLVRLLRLDGTVAHHFLTLDELPDDNIGKFSVGADGISMLQRVDESTFRVLRFPLPTTLFGDPVPTTVVDETTVATEVVAAEVATTVEVEPTVTTSVESLSVGTVLYAATVGAGDGQLGLEDCLECEPLAPLAPMVAPDGSVIIADTFNRRWVTVRDGVESYLPYPADIIVQDAVLGRDGNVYWVAFATDPIAPAPLFSGVQFAPFDDLAAAAPMQPPAFEGAGFETISFDGSGEPAVEDPTLTIDDANREDLQFIVRHGLGEPALSVTMDDDGESTVVATYVDGTSQSWTLGIAGLDPQLPTLHVVAESELLVAIQTAPLSQEARILHFVNVLYPDGTVNTFNLPPGVTTAGTAGHWSITPDGVTTLIFDAASDLFQVVRYSLPS